MRLDGEERPLTGYQFALLLVLAERAGRVLTRDALMDLMKGEKLEAFDRSVDVHVSRIRAAIEDDPKKPQAHPDGARHRLRLRPGPGPMTAPSSRRADVPQRAECRPLLAALSTKRSLGYARDDVVQRLYLQFYATILLVLAVFVGAAALTWKLAEDARRRSISTSPPS